MYLCIHAGDARQLWLGLGSEPRAYGFRPVGSAFRSALAPALCARGDAAWLLAVGLDQGLYAAPLARDGTARFARVGSGALTDAAPALSLAGEELACALRGTDQRLWWARGATPERWSFACASELAVSAAPALCEHEGALWLAAVDDAGALRLGPLGDSEPALDAVAGAPECHRAPSLCSFAGVLRVALVDDAGRLYLGSFGDEGARFELAPDAPLARGGARLWDADGRLAVSVTAEDTGALHVGLEEDGALRWSALEGTQASGPAAFAYAPGYDFADPDAELDADWGAPVVTDESLEAPTLHAILCGWGAGIGVPEDIALHRELLARLQEAGVVKVREHAVYGLDAAPERVLAALDALETQEQDVVWCVFSGHGASAQGDNYWCARGGLLRRADVVDRVRSQPARLRVVLSDCCSSELGRVAPKKKLGRARAPAEDHADAWRCLLLEHEGVFDVTSSSEYQFSFAGVFTPALVRETLLRAPPRSWHVVFERVRELCQQAEGALPRDLVERFERVGAHLSAAQTPWAFALPAPRA